MTFSKIAVALLAATALMVGCTDDQKPSQSLQTSGASTMTSSDQSTASASANPMSADPPSVAPAADATSATPKAAPAAVVPKPTSVQPTDSNFALRSTTQIVTAPGEPQRIGTYLAHILLGSTGIDLPVVETATSPTDTIALRIDAAATGDESYTIDVTGDSVLISAAAPAGLFNGVQTLRQLLPATPVGDGVAEGFWTIPGGRIEDSPRFAWRGAMLDVSRHFFDVASVKKYIDDIALYKMNVLHLHLSDDQGWRIQIDSWPKLTELGSRYEVGGGEGGFYTKADYADIVAYAQERFVTIVPEIDMPGHTNAALSSYAELNCDGKLRKPYTGTEVGFSSLCVASEATYKFVTDVVAELAAMTPGDYIHIGGDEVETLTDTEYATFVERVDGIVQKAGKKTLGWAEIGAAEIGSGAVVQYWNSGPVNDNVRNAVERGARVLMSPADKSYLDMKYDEDTKTGLKWAGLIEVKDAWDWDPATYFDYVPAEQIVGVEAPIWSETLETIEDVEFLAFPRLPAIAEVAWSATDGRDWDDFRTRLATHAPRWRALAINYYPSPQIDWVK